MTKDIAIFLVKNKLGVDLSLNNTNWSNINSNGIWSVEPNVNRTNNILFLILNNNKSKKLHVFKISSKDEVFSRFYKRNDKPVYRLLFDVDDLKFVETLKDINFKKFYIGSVLY